MRTMDDFNKMKVNDLKKELKVRGLSVSGNKNELVARLMLDDSRKSPRAESDILEDELLNDEYDDTATSELVSDSETEKILNDTATSFKESSSSEELGPPAKKFQLISSEMEEYEESISSNGNNLNTENQNVIKISNISAKERLELRAKKFGVSISQDAKKLIRAERFGNAGGSVTKNSPIVVKSDFTSTDKLKQRALRFGVISKDAATLEQKEKLAKRKARFAQ